MLSGSENNWVGRAVCRPKRNGNMQPVLAAKRLIRGALKLEEIVPIVWFAVVNGTVSNPHRLANLLPMRLVCLTRLAMFGNGPAQLGILPLMAVSKFVAWMRRNIACCVVALGSVMLAVRVRPLVTTTFPFFVATVSAFGWFVSPPSLNSWALRC